jgi:hypothetical protein
LVEENMRLKQKIGALCDVLWLSWEEH